MSASAARIFVERSFDKYRILLRLAYVKKVARIFFQARLRRTSLRPARRPGTQKRWQATALHSGLAAARRWLEGIAGFSLLTWRVGDSRKQIMETPLLA